MDGGGFGQGTEAGLLPRLLGDLADSHSFRPVWWIWNALAGPIDQLHVMAAAGDLLARPLLTTIGFLLLATLVIRLEELREYLPYTRPDRYRIWKRLFGVEDEPTQSRYREQQKQDHRLGRFLNWFRDAFLHPWALVTQTNPRRELLMADLLTTEGSLYSGKFITWVPEGEGLGAIAIQYAIRYHPKVEGRERGKVLIPNNGELVIPASQISSAHFWEIRRNRRWRVAATKPNDLDVVKWHLVLAFVHPRFFRHIEILVDLDPENLDRFAADLSAWMEANRISFPENRISITFPGEYEAAPSA